MEEAVKAAEAGVDAVVVQGVEAGGHIIGTVRKAGLISLYLLRVEPLELKLH